MIDVATTTAFVNRRLRHARRHQPDEWSAIRYELDLTARLLAEDAISGQPLHRPWADEFTVLRGMQLRQLQLQDMAAGRIAAG